LKPDHATDESDCIEKYCRNRTWFKHAHAQNSFILFGRRHTIALGRRNKIILPARDEYDCKK
jgi:hypothetical protein